ncbi:unnamed protein product [Moneuplotes crassus]|uniref:Nucleoplasmin-like domain-containing protein n=1 Tax=Euplotes crassus TaxID=5936 RepID=A0AAD1XWH8_EUPCR|nr:unnamed protein product [Moneuplotes crassus]
MFWSCEIKQGHNYTIPDIKGTIEDEDLEPGVLVLTSIQLSESTVSEKVKVMVQEYENEFQIASLSSNCCSHKVKLQFEQGDRACFSIIGKGSVILSGYWEDPPAEFDFDPYNPNEGFPTIDQENTLQNQLESDSDSEMGANDLLKNTIQGMAVNENEEMSEESEEVEDLSAHEHPGSNSSSSEDKPNPLSVMFKKKNK